MLVTGKDFVTKYCHSNITTGTILLLLFKRRVFKSSSRSETSNLYKAWLNAATGNIYIVKKRKILCRHVRRIKLLASFNILKSLLQADSLTNIVNIRVDKIPQKLNDYSLPCVPKNFMKIYLYLLDQKLAERQIHNNNLVGDNYKNINVDG